MNAKFIHARSFSAKLIITVTLVVTLSVTLVCSSIVALELWQARQRAASTATTQARIVSLNVTAALAFQDPTTAEETLGSLSAVPNAIYARIYDADGRVFADYTQQNQQGSLPEFGHDGEPLVFADTRLITRQPIQLDGEHLGTLVIIYDLGDLYATLLRNTIIAFGIGLGAWAVGFLLTIWLKRGLTRPVDEMNRVAGLVTETQDFTVRARKYSDDELGDLTDRFNTMLDRVRHADEQLQMANDELESRVAQRTNELETATLDAQAANTAKTHFLANMSHEIRTPMTAILGYSEMLLDTSQSPEDTLDCVQTIHRNGRHLLTIINDILDISKIEAGAMTVETIQASVVQIVADVASVTRIRAIEKGISYQVLFDGPIPEYIQTDPTRLRQILINIVGNAIKFTDVGGVTLRVRLCQAADGTPAHMRFEVHDTGIGIDVTQLANLFRPFSQTDDSMTRRFGGTGLGLAISKQLALMLGGDITVQSERGLGSKFCVTAQTGPLEEIKLMTGVTEADVQAHEAPNLQIGQHQLGDVHFDARVLLVEDGEDNRRFISRFLKKLGVSITLAENGEVGRDVALQALAEGQAFDLILMDMQMPVMDGYTAARKLRLAGYTGSIVALTAHAMAHDRQKCLDAGCNDYLTKPIQHAKLVDTVARHSRSCSPQNSGSEAALPAAQQPAPSSTPCDNPLYSRYIEDPFLADLVIEFVAALPQRVAALESAIAGGQLDDVKVLVHQLKGAAGTHGFDEISESARDLNDLIQTVDEVGAVEAEMQQLIKLCLRATAARKAQIAS